MYCTLKRLLAFLFRRHVLGARGINFQTLFLFTAQSSAVLWSANGVQQKNKLCCLRPFPLLSDEKVVH